MITWKQHPTIISNNFGPDTATNIIVKYSIGTGLIYQGYSLITGGINKVTYDGQNLTYYINLPANSIAIILIYLQTNTTGTQTPQLTTTASLISVDQNETGPNPNTETQKLTIPNTADIQVQQNINGTTEITTNNNQDITLTLTVKNNGTYTATANKTTPDTPYDYNTTTTHKPTTSHEQQYKKTIHQKRRI